MDPRNSNELWDVMWDRNTIDFGNEVLGAAIRASRERRGYDAAKAASLVKLTESEFVAVESNPMLISPSIIYDLMDKLGAADELVEALNTITANHLKNIRLRKVKSTKKRADD